MKPIAMAAGIALAAGAAPALAQGGSAPGGASACYVELAKLMAGPPAGIGELGAALRDLEAALRPQVDLVNQLRTRMARLEQRQAALSTNPADSGLEPVGLAPLQPADETTLAEMQELQAELDALRAQLKQDYTAQRRVIVGPVQARIGEGARTYGAEQGCSEIRMARKPDLPALTAAGARDVTGGFVAWYAGRSGLDARASR